jgi:hypothetical protein
MTISCKYLGFLKFEQNLTKNVLSLRLVVTEVEWAPVEATSATVHKVAAIANVIILERGREGARLAAINLED